MNKKLIKTLCTQCLNPLECEWDEQMQWAGQMIPAEDYMGNILKSETHSVLCDECMDILMTIPEGMEIEYI
jgi:hypothetical protein